MENQQIQIIQNKPTSLNSPPPPNNWTTSLVGILPDGNGLTLTESESSEIALSLTELDFKVALQSEKLFQLKSTIGEANIFKSVCALLKMFSDATKVNKPLSSSEIIMCSDWMVRKYTHESIADFALALKEGIFGGHKFYGSVTIADVKEVIEKYFDLKAEQLEQIVKSNKIPIFDQQDPIIAKITQGLIPDYSEPLETFSERFERERRVKAGEDFRKFQEKLKNFRDSEPVYVEFQQINQPQNDDYYQETSQSLEG